MARRPSGSRNQLFNGTAQGCFEDGKSDVEGLKEEMDEWANSLESNNMEHLPKYEEVTECRDALEAALDRMESIEVPEVLGEVEVTYTQDTRKSATSRSSRLDNARNQLEAAQAAAEQWLDENEELEATDDLEEGDEKITEEMVDERHDTREAVQNFVDELDSALSELDSVSFPGMF